MNQAILLDLANEMHCVLDKQFRIVFINEVFVRHLRSQDKDLRAYSFIDLVVGSERENLLAEFAKASTEWNTSISCALENDNGNILAFTARMRWDGEYYYICGNIVLQQQGYSSLLGRFRRHFDISLIELLLILDKSRKIAYISPNFAQKMQYEAQELIGKNFFDFVLTEDQAQAQSFLNDLSVQEGKTDQQILRLQCKQGNVYWFAWLMIYNKGHFLTIASDLTQIKENERQLTQKNTDLIASENRLKATLQELELRNAELDSFVYQVSHELRSPVSSALGIIDIERANMSLLAHSTIQESLLKLDKRIHTLGDFKEGTRTELDISHIDFPTLIQDALQSLRRFYVRLPQVNIKVVPQADFFSDNNKIKIIFKHLIANVEDYGKPNQAAFCDIEIIQNQEHAIILLQDQGVGIPKSFKEKAFGMYQRGENSKGSGMGLYVVKQVVEKLEGNITLDSIPNKGTSFRICLKNFISK